MEEVGLTIHDKVKYKFKIFTFAHSQHASYKVHFYEKGRNFKQLQIHLLNGTKCFCEFSGNVYSL